MDQETAIKNVKEQVGADAKIISCTKGYTPVDNFACWVITVTPANSTETLTYYSGYQFCYLAGRISDVSSSSTENPMLKYIGNYSNGNKDMNIACYGKDQVSIYITFWSSNSELTVWSMSGKVKPNDKTIITDYNNCVKTTYVYAENGTVSSSQINYEGGKGTIELSYADGRIYWYDSVENASGGNAFVNEKDFSDVGIDEATAINNVKEQVGSDITVNSSKKGYSPDGLRCWVITVTTANTNEVFTYYAGSQFCYRDTQSTDNYGIGISEQTAIDNVKAQLGSDITVNSCTNGYSPDGLSCWIVNVNVPNCEVSLRYYSGYQFCYRDAEDAEIYGIGIYQETAIQRVKEQAGSDAVINSCTKGYSPVENSWCWVVNVTPANSSTARNYYVCHYFCYTDTKDSDTYGIGIDETTAINNVKAQIGSDITVNSCTKGKDGSGIDCWVINVTPVNSKESYTYYSGYQFCYRDTKASDNINVGIDETTAISNVKKQVGSGAKIISCTKGYDLNGLGCWVVVVAPITNGTGSETVTYYSGYQFCYCDTKSSDNINVGIDEATAVSNVKKQVGSGATIISCTKGYDLNGLGCWVVVVAPVTNGTSPETVTYYSGYQFCYSVSDNSQSANTQNPIMNYIGNYTNGRATMNVAASGKNQAVIQISWGSSAFDTSTWYLTGTVTTSNEGVSISYNNCTKQTFKYDENGNLLSNYIDYEGGSGSISFLYADNNAYWYDAQEGAGNGTSFWFSN